MKALKHFWNKLHVRKTLVKGRLSRNHLILLAISYMKEKNNSRIQSYGYDSLLDCDGCVA